MNLLIISICLLYSVVNSINYNRDGKLVKILSLKGPLHVPKSLKTIGNMKNYIRNEYEVHHIEVYSKGKRLSDDVVYCEETHKDLSAMSTIRGGMNIRVETMHGKTIEMEVTENETVLDLKKKLKEKQDIPVDQQRIIYEGKLLQDNKTLAEYNIKNNSKIHLVLRLRGGVEGDV